jgi:hypothetical protein
VRIRHDQIINKHKIRVQDGPIADQSSIRGITLLNFGERHIVLPGELLFGAAIGIAEDADRMTQEARFAFELLANAG